MLLQRLRNRSLDDPDILSFLKVTPYGLRSHDVEAGIYGRLALLHHSARKLLARYISLVDAPERIEEVELFPEAIPVKELHDRGAQETPVDATLHEVARKLGGRDGGPQTDGHPPVP